MYLIPDSDQVNLFKFQDFSLMLFIAYKAHKLFYCNIGIPKQNQTFNILEYT